MKKTITSLLICVALFSPAALRAEEPKSDPNVSYGFGLTGGYASMWQRISKGESKNEWTWGYCYGAGFVLEKMFTNILGIHTGLWYLGSMINMTPGDDIKTIATTHTLSLPLYLIVSANKGIFSFNFLVGADITVIIDCSLHGDSDSLPNKTANVQKYLSPAQFGVALGFNFKFRVATYVDYYFGFIGDFYVSSLERQHDGYESYAHMYDGRLITGVLFRTNLFPIQTTANK